MQTLVDLRQLSFLATLVLTTTLAAACDKESPPAAPSGVQTATPFAKPPEPTIVPATSRTPGGTSTSPAGATPTPVTTATPATGGVDITYAVVAGDAMSLIAQRFGVTSAAIRAANNLPNDDIRIGQILKIPRGTASGTPTPGPTVGPPRPTPPPVTGDTYLVKPGDTAYGIALEFQVTLAELEQVNGVAPGGLNNIKAGETIRVPKPR